MQHEHPLLSRRNCQCIVQRHPRWAQQVVDLAAHGQNKPLGNRSHDGFANQHLSWAVLLRTKIAANWGSRTLHPNVSHSVAAHALRFSWRQRGCGFGSSAIRCPVTDLAAPVTLGICHSLLSRFVGLWRFRSGLVAPIHDVKIGLQQNTTRFTAINYKSAAAKPRRIRLEPLSRRTFWNSHRFLFH